MPVKETQIPLVKDANGTYMDDEDALAYWLVHGRAKLVRRGETWTDEDLPEKFAVEDAAVWQDVPDDLSDNKQRTRDLLRVIDDNCSEDERLLLWRHDVMLMTFEQIAKLDGISRQAAHKRYAKLVQRLRQAGAEYLRG